MFQFLSIQDIMLLIQLASKSAEFSDHMWSGLMQDHKTFEADQWRAAVKDATSVLVKIDREQPGLMPLPHDGRSWAERGKDEKN